MCEIFCGKNSWGMKYFEFFRECMKLFLVFHNSLLPRYLPYLMTFSLINSLLKGPFNFGFVYSRSYCSGKHCILKSPNVNHVLWHVFTGLQCLSSLHRKPSVIYLILLYAN